MGLFNKKNIENEENISSSKKTAKMHRKIEKAHGDLARRKQNMLEQNNICASVQQEIDRIAEECKILQEQNKKRWKKIWILCFLLFLLGVGLNVVVVSCYDKSMEKEYNEKRVEFEQRLSEEE